MKELWKNIDEMVVNFHDFFYQFMSVLSACASPFFLLWCGKEAHFSSFLGVAFLPLVE